jgi:uncharacterized membrane protein
MSGAPLIFPTETRDLITAVSHYYRGELSRMISWRNRIDLTTNWAIGAVAGMLSLSLSASTEHGLLLFAMLIVLLILFIEARRYRFYDLYRGRVRLLERQYYAPLFGGTEVHQGEAWMRQLGEGLRAPSFNVTLGQALSRRLRRNYGWLFLVLLLAWVLKATGLLAHQTLLLSPEGTILPHAAIGAIPGSAVAAGVLLFYVSLMVLTLRHRHESGELAYGSAHM